jgi:hypothetical protein
MAIATMNTHQFNNSLPSFGLGRMSEDEYEREFNIEEEGETATPRPGTSKTDNAAAARAASHAIRSFSQLAAATASANKRRTTTRTDYRMAANLIIKKALDDMQERLRKQRTSATTTSSPDSVMSEEDFGILRQAIEKFSVRIVVHDSITLDQLKQMQLKCQADLDIHTAMMTLPVSGDPSDAAFIRKCQEEYKSDLTQLNVSLSTEIRRMRTANETVPSQHAQIARSSGMTLQNILSPETSRRIFLSLNALTRAIRSDLLAFLANDFRSKDHAIVVQQIKNSRTAAKKH